MLKCKICEKEADLGDLVCTACYDRINGMFWCSCPDPSPFWICLRCATTESTTATVGSAATASQLAPTTATTTDTAESASQEVQQLKADVVELKAEIEMLKAEVVELKSELKAVVDQHVASEAAHDEVTQKLKQTVENLMA